MGILDRVERGLERAFNGAFAKTFRSGLQPVEISAALKRELDTHAAVVSRERILVPNAFDIRVCTADYDRLTALGNSLTQSLLQEVQTHARTQNYQFAGPLTVQFLDDESLSEGQLDITSKTVEGRIDWMPVLDVNGTRYPLRRGSTVIGRGTDAEITIDDAGASRRHAEVVWDGRRAGVRDLGSTNGTKLDGRRISQAALTPDSLIEIGRTTLVFRVVPQQVTVDEHFQGGAR